MTFMIIILIPYNSNYSFFRQLYLNIKVFKHKIFIFQYILTQGSKIFLFAYFINQLII